MNNVLQIESIVIFNVNNSLYLKKNQILILTCAASGIHLLVLRAASSSPD
jgi:hypothetical protein